eukprot:3292089-Rhodomonas_salina.2
MLAQRDCHVWRQARGCRRASAPHQVLTCRHILVYFAEHRTDIAHGASREELGIKEDIPDVFETPDPPEPAPSAELAAQERELETARRGTDCLQGFHRPLSLALTLPVLYRRAEKEVKPSQSQSIDRAPLQPGHVRGVFVARDAVSLPAETDFSHAAHVRRTQEWRVLGYRQRPLETPQDRYNRCALSLSLSLTHSLTHTHTRVPTQATGTDAETHRPVQTQPQPHTHIKHVMLCAENARSTRAPTLSTCSSTASRTDL